MTEHEFAAGWKLLLLQSWAYRYRGQNEFGEPSKDAKGQQEFYYDQLKHASGEAWKRIATEYAKGKEWPSIDSLKRSLSSITNRTYAQPDQHGGPLLDHDEFGRDLYDAIRLQSAQVQCEKNAVIYEQQGLTRIAASSRQDAGRIREELTAIFQRDTLTPEELRRVLAIGSEHAS